jgi:hypothetical protein
VTTTGPPVTATSSQIHRIRKSRGVLFRAFADPRFPEDVIGEPGPRR